MRENLDRHVGPASGYLPIADYAVVGDGRTAALVSRAGSIDWLCLPRFDCPSIFARLLDARHGGSFSIQPAGLFSATRAYDGPTNVLVTTFTTPNGVLRLTDWMPALDERAKERVLLPSSLLLRRVECVAGAVDVVVECSPRPDYARRLPTLEPAGPATVRVDLGDALLQIGGDLPLAVRGPDVRGQVRLSVGERRTIALTYDDGPAVRPPIGEVADRLLEMTRAYWRRWSDRLTFDGPYRDAVLRSALALRQMIHGPSGAIVAAPTTSLPEAIGGARNWDYRYCWLRDAAFTVRALFALGYADEAVGFVSWLLHATRLTQPAVQMLYSVYGTPPARERSLPWLEGYGASRPVRVGNAAAEQFQLDVYGELLDAVALMRRSLGHVDLETCRFLLGLARVVARRWREPDHGIWELRAGCAQHVYSKVMAWVALSRMIEIAEAERLPFDVSDLERTRREIRQFVETHGYDARLGTYTRLVGGDDVDASLLQLPLVDFVEPDDPRMLRTIEAVCRQLGAGPTGLIYRYRAPDGLPPGEGAFAVCSFWLVEALARAGRLDDAHRIFAALVGRANDVGLYAEEIDPATGAFLGNFPQAFTHLGLINAAVTLAEVEQEEDDATERAECAGLGVCGDDRPDDVDAG